MYNYKITIEYEGTNFVGWQRQDNGLSVQQLIEESIQKLSNSKNSISSFVFSFSKSFLAKN